MWVVWCSLWIFFLFTTVQRGLGLSSSNECRSAFGLEDGRVSDSQLKASSFYENLNIGDGKTARMEPKHARLNNKYAWCAPHQNAYIQVNLHQNSTITGIGTQGYEGRILHYFVTKYRVIFSSNGRRWRNATVLRGNFDAQSVVNHSFSPAIFARHIRIYPVSYTHRICLRMELYGCSISSTGISSTRAPTSPTTTHPTTSENIPSTSKQTAAGTKAPRHTGSVKGPDHVMPMSLITTKEPRTGSTKQTGINGEVAAQVDVDESKKFIDPLAVGFTVPAVVLIICLVLSFSIYLCRRRRRKRSGSDIDIIECADYDYDPGKAQLL